MRRKIAYILKYNLLTALLVAGVFCSAVGITWCRYQKTEKMAVNFQVYGPGNFVLLGKEEGQEPGVWYQEETTGNMRMDFSVANGSAENYPAEDSRFILRLLTTEGIPADATVTLTVEEEDGLRQVYTGQEETIVLEGKYLILGNEMGKGTRYRFVQENGEEAVFGLQGGKRSIVRCSIVVSGETLPFLAELRLVDAAYGVESYTPTGYAPMDEGIATYILPEWQEGQTNPETQLILTAKDADFYITGTLTCTADSPYVVPTLRLTEEVADSEASGNAGSMDTSEGTGSGKLENETPKQEFDGSVTVNLAETNQQSVYIELVPDMEALSQIKEPVLTAVTVQWQISSDEEKVIEAKLLIVLNPVKEKPAEVPDQEAMPDGEGISDEENVPDGEGASGEETVPNEEGVAGEETVPEDEDTAREEDASDGENPSSEGYASSEEGGPNDENQTDNATKEAEVEATALSEIQTTEAENSTDSLEPTEPEAPESSKESTDSTEPTGPGEDSTEESTESTEPIEPETDSTEESTESIEPIEPGTDSTENIAEPLEPEIDTYTFLVPTTHEVYQVAITGIQEQLSVYHILIEQQEKDEFTGNALEQRLSELRIISNLSNWEFELPASGFTWETTVEALTDQGFVVVENRNKPEVIVTDVAEGDYLGGKHYTVTVSQVLAGTYRLVLTAKTEDNIVLHTERIPFFVNYRFDTALETEAVQEEQVE